MLELRKFLAVLIYTGFKKQEAELFLKLSVDCVVLEAASECIMQTWN